MADTKISALVAASAAALTNELPINEAGASKKLTLAQIQALLGVTKVVMASDQADITGTGLVELTELTVTGVGIGTWRFDYHIIYQTTATTTGVEFVVDHTGTDTAFVSNAMFGSTGGAAATGIADQVGTGTAAGIMEVKAQRTAGARPGVTIGVDTINSNCLMRIEGTIVVSVSGSLQLFMAAELATLVCRAKAGSNLVLTRVG
jgi:hypothetical protein